MRTSTIVAALWLAAAPVMAQTHAHIGPASGIPQGIPRFCAEAAVTSVTGGAWSSPATWSTGRVPAVGESVLIKPGHSITYDTSSDAALRCVDVEGALTFRTDVNTRLKVGTLVGVRIQVSGFRAGPGIRPEASALFPRQL